MQRGEQKFDRTREQDVASGNSRTAGNRVSRSPSMRIILEPQGSKFLSQTYAKNIDGSDYSKNE